MSIQTRFHYVSPYLLNPQHPVTVNVIGCGGTGSHVLTGLVALHEALVGLGHPGLHVTAFDSDTVSEANIGRQKFSPADVGMNKAVVLIGRINRYMGSDWRAIPSFFTEDTLNIESVNHANITLSCVDTISSRKTISQLLNKTFLEKENANEPYVKPIYWMDFGNDKKSGQVILSTLSAVKQSEKDGVAVLPDLFKSFPSLLTKKEPVNTPSCSMRESLFKQDLYINSTLAQVGLNILWKMFRELKLKARGAFINLDTIKTNPIPV